LMTGTIAAHQSVGSVTDLISPDSTMLLISGRVISHRVDDGSLTGKIHWCAPANHNGCHLYRTVQYSVIVTLKLLFCGRSDKSLYNVFNSSYSLECYFG
jgi:hypothetical protein